MMPPTNSISEMLSKETIHWRHIYEWGFRKTLNVRGTNLVPSRFLLALEPIERQALAQKAFEQGYLQQKKGKKNIIWGYTESSVDRHCVFG